MNGELNFEAMSFEGYDRLPALTSEQTGFEFEEEYGRRGARQRPQGFGSHAQRIRSAQRPPSPVSRPGKPKAPRIPPIRVGGLGVQSMGLTSSRPNRIPLNRRRPARSIFVGRKAR